MVQYPFGVSIASAWSKVVGSERLILCASLLSGNTKALIRVTGRLVAYHPIALSVTLSVVGGAGGAVGVAGGVVGVAGGAAATGVSRFSSCRWSSTIVACC